MLSVVGGYFGLPQVWGDLFGIPESNSLGNFLAPVLAQSEPHPLEHATEYLMAVAAIAVALAALVSYASGRTAWLARQLARFAYLGYATPGVIAGVGLLIVSSTSTRTSSRLASPSTTSIPSSSAA